MPTRPLKIGITGGIGSGKSLVSHIFSILGVPCYNADLRARWLIENNQVIIEGIKAEFGSKAYTNGKLNRGLIAGVTFSNVNKLELLNRLVHPAVAKDYNEWLEDQRDEAYCLKEAALLIETGSYKTLDSIIVVVAPLNMRVQRVLARDPFRSESEINDIIDKQLGDDEKLRHSHYQVINDESCSVIEQVLSLHKRLSSKSISS